MDNIIRDKAGEESASTKKPYKAPTFRFETAFEVAALACGKIDPISSVCKSVRKAS